MRLSTSTLIGVALGLLGMVLAFAPTPTLGVGGVVKGPNVTAPDHYVYCADTEKLSKNETLLFACGTGLPAAQRDLADAFKKDHNMN